MKNKNETVLMFAKLFLLSSIVLLFTDNDKDHLIPYNCYAVDPSDQERKKKKIQVIEQNISATRDRIVEITNRMYYEKNICDAAYKNLLTELNLVERNLKSLEAAKRALN